MNLYDLLERKDRSVIEREGVTTEQAKFSGRLHRVVRFSPGAVLVLGGAHEFNLLAGMPTDLNWRLLGERDAASRLAIEIRNAGTTEWLTLGRPSTRHESIRNAVSGLLDGALASADDLELPLSWPPAGVSSRGFDLRLRSVASKEVVLSVCRPLDPRRRILPALTGDGVEVGPGTNPKVLPGPGLSVRYVEEASPEEWARRYVKSAPVPEASRALWKHYIVDSAQTLESITDESIDFVFSNHVFEHLPNPLGVLRNWLRKLRPGGVIAGAVPDARYTFDLRQPLSERADFEREHDAGLFGLQHEHYVRWVRYTAPYNTVEELRARGYSIHVHFYTPAVFAGLVSLLGDAIDQFFIDSAPNNKDFGFLLRKA